jgi:hypothetical protein
VIAGQADPTKPAQGVSSGVDPHIDGGQQSAFGGAVVTRARTRRRLGIPLSVRAVLARRPGAIFRLRNIRPSVRQGGEAPEIPAFFRNPYARGRWGLGGDYYDTGVVGYGGLGDWGGGYRVGPYRDGGGHFGRGGCGRSIPGIPTGGRGGGGHGCR